MPLHCCSTASDAHQQDPEHLGLQQIPETHVLNFLGGERVLNFRPPRRRHAPPPIRARICARPFDQAILHQPARTFRQKQRAEEEQERRHGHGRKHPPPAVLAVPGLADGFRRGPLGHLLGNQPVDDLAPSMPRTMVNWLIATSRPRRWAGRHLGDVHRRKVRGQADGHPAE